MTVAPLPDRWTTRDFPVLIELARLLDDGVPVVQSNEVDIDGIDEEAVIRACVALKPSYIEGSAIDTMGGVVGFLVSGLTERGRRAVGLWPSGESVDALIEALKLAEQATEDPEERSLIRRAIGAVTAISRDIMVDVTAAVIAKQVNGG